MIHIFKIQLIPFNSLFQHCNIVSSVYHSDTLLFRRTAFCICFSHSIQLSPPSAIWLLSQFMWRQHYAGNGQTMGFCRPPKYRVSLGKLMNASTVGADSLLHLKVAFGKISHVNIQQIPQLDFHKASHSDSVCQEVTAESLHGTTVSGGSGNLLTLAFLQTISHTHSYTHTQMYWFTNLCREADGGDDRYDYWCQKISTHQGLQVGHSGGASTKGITDNEWVSVCVCAHECVRAMRRSGVQKTSLFFIQTFRISSFKPLVHLILLCFIFCKRLLSPKVTGFNVNFFFIVWTLGSYLHNFRGPLRGMQRKYYLRKCILQQTRYESFWIKASLTLKCNKMFEKHTFGSIIFSNIPPDLNFIHMFTGCASTCS